MPDPKSESVNHVVCCSSDPSRIARQVSETLFTLRERARPSVSHPKPVQDALKKLDDARRAFRDLDAPFQSAKAAWNTSPSMTEADQATATDEELGRHVRRRDRLWRAYEATMRPRDNAWSAYCNAFGEASDALRAAYLPELPDRYPH